MNSLIDLLQRSGFDGEPPEDLGKFVSATEESRNRAMASLISARKSEEAVAVAQKHSPLAESREISPNMQPSDQIASDNIMEKSPEYVQIFSDDSEEDDFLPTVIVFILI